MYAETGNCIDQKSCYAKLFGMKLKCESGNFDKMGSESLATALVVSTATMLAAVATTI